MYYGLIELKTFKNQYQNLVITPRGGGGGTPLYKLYRYVSPHWVGFLRRFGQRTGIQFAHFGLGSGMVFEGTTAVYKLKASDFWTLSFEDHGNRSRI